MLQKFAPVNACHCFVFVFLVHSSYSKFQRWTKCSFSWDFIELHFLGTAQVFSDEQVVLKDKADALLVGSTVQPLVIVAT